LGLRGPRRVSVCFSWLRINQASANWRQVVIGHKAVDGRFNRFAVLVFILRPEAGLGVKEFAGRDRFNAGDDALTICGHCAKVKLNFGARAEVRCVFCGDADHVCVSLSWRAAVALADDLHIGQVA